MLIYILHAQLLVLQVNIHSRVGRLVLHAILALIVLQMELHHVHLAQLELAILAPEVVVPLLVKVVPAVLSLLQEPPVALALVLRVLLQQEPAVFALLEIIYLRILPHAQIV